MVEVGVHIYELLTRVLLLQNCPSTSAEASSVPTLRYLVGSLREPECAAIDKLHLIFEVEDRHKLALALAVVTTYADVAVLGKILHHIIHLVGARLLQAENCGALLVHKVERRLLAVLPVVDAVGLLGSRTEANVVGHNFNLRCAVARHYAQKCCGAEQSGEKFLHIGSVLVVRFNDTYC